MVTVFVQNIDGYWLGNKCRTMPQAGGVFFVYRGQKLEQEYGIQIIELLYIGEASDVGETIMEHEYYNDWQAELKGGERLCFSFSEVKKCDRQHVLSAFILHHKPRMNDHEDKCFLFPNTRIVTLGAISKLSEEFVVKTSVLNNKEK